MKKGAKILLIQVIQGKNDVVKGFKADHHRPKRRCDLFGADIFHPSRGNKGTPHTTETDFWTDDLEKDLRPFLFGDLYSLVSKSIASPFALFLGILEPRSSPKSDKTSRWAKGGDTFDNSEYLMMTPQYLVASETGRLVLSFARAFSLSSPRSRLRPRNPGDRTRGCQSRTFPAYCIIL